MSTWITTTDKTADYQLATDDEMVFLGQVIDIDGEDAVVTDREPVRNGSGRVCGEHLTITAEAWEFVQEALRRTE